MALKALISRAVTAQLICAFVFAYANCWFSDAAALILMAIHVHMDSYAFFKIMPRRNCQQSIRIKKCSAKYQGTDFAFFKTHENMAFFWKFLDSRKFGLDMDSV